MITQSPRGKPDARGKRYAYRGCVRMPATCGELAQGMIEGIHFHVSCPIDLFATIQVELSPDAQTIYADARLTKAKAAVAAALADLGGKRLGGRLVVESPIPRGKGMGSSTADVAGSIYATGEALGAMMTPRRVAELALGIEPTDGSVFPHVVVFDHRHGLAFESLGTPPPLGILVLDFGGEVDTVEFNREDRSALLRDSAPIAKRSLELIKQGFRLHRPNLIGLGATLSAEANQRILYKPQLDPVRRFAESAHALGVVAAHSGSVLGVLFDPLICDGDELRDVVCREFPALCATYVHRLVGGGARPLP